MNITSASSVHHPYPRSSVCTQMMTTNTALLASLSMLTSLLLTGHWLRCSPSWRLFSQTLIYATSFTVGNFGARSIRLASPEQIRYFGHSLTHSLLLHNFLTLVAGGSHFISRQPRFMRCSMVDPRSDMPVRLFTSMLHLIAGFTLNFDGTERS